MDISESIKTEKRARILRCNPRKGGAEHRIIDERQEPAYVISEDRPKRYFRVVHKPVDLFIFAAQRRKDYGADDHDQSYASDNEQALAHIAAGEREYLDCLEENTAPDDRAYDHADRREQAVLFLELVVHNETSFFKKLNSCCFLL